LDEDDRVGWLMQLLDFGNLPKSFKKQALFEISRSLGLRFSREDLEDIERKFALLSMKYDGVIRCPFCLARVAVEARSSRRKPSQVSTTAYSKHIEGCTTLASLIARHYATVVRRPAKKGGS
jgi:hypothetical protein